MNSSFADDFRYQNLQPEVEAMPAVKIWPEVSGRKVWPGMESRDNVVDVRSQSLKLKTEAVRQA